MGKIGIVFEKNENGTYDYKSVNLFSSESDDILKDSLTLEFNEEKFNSFSNKKDESFAFQKKLDNKYITLVVSESLYKTLFDHFKSDDGDEACIERVMDNLRVIASNINNTNVAEFACLRGFRISFNKKEKELEANGSVSNSSVDPISESEFVIDMSKIDPNEVISNIKSKVIAQDDAVETIVNNIYNNQLLFDTGDDDLISSSKSSILMDGPTGTGKTLIIKEVAKELELPMIIRSSTMFSAAGYKGSDLSEILVGLLETTGGNLEAAERGIVVLDEFDKLANDSNSELEMRKAVQQELLTYLGGAKFPVEYKGKKYEFDTSKITFICLGAFQDLREKKIAEELDSNGNYTMKPDDYIRAGLLREIVGRFSLITATKSLPKADLIRILNESSISPLIQLKSMAKDVYGIDISYSDEIVDKIASDAVLEDTGARALQTTINGLRNVILSDLISKNIDHIELTQDIIDKAKEVYVREGGVKK